MKQGIWNKLSLSTKISLFMLLIATLSIFLFLNIKYAHAASLKPVSIINEDVLRLGDLFDNLRHNADYVIGPAPQPGRDMTLNARTLYRIAVALDLSWRPSSNSDQITVRRQASIVSYDLIETQLRQALNEQGVFGRFKVQLNSGEPTIILPSAMPETVEITSFRYDHGKNFLQATLVAPSAENPLRKMVVNGMVERIAVVPVLRNTLQNGDIIGRNDIELIEVPEQQIQHNAIMNAEDLVGMTPRRVAYGGKFVLSNMLQRPQLVERGEKVSITFREGPLVLSAKGTALQSGAKGDFIRVKNLNSGRMVDATVMASNQVVIQ